MSGLSEYLRLFVAVLLDPDLRRTIRTEADAVLQGTGRVGRVAEENLHVTLKFIGDVHRDDVPALDEALRDAGDLLAAGEIEVEGIGAFPDLRRPRVIWAGVSDPSGILTPVHARLNETLAPFGAKRERKRYVPHVTLGRVRGPFDADRLARQRAEAGDAPTEGEGGLWLGTQDVNAIALMMSELGGGPPRHTVLGHY